MHTKIWFLNIKREHIDTSNQKAHQETIFKHEQNTYAKTNNKNTLTNDIWKMKTKTRFHTNNGWENIHSLA